MSKIYGYSLFESFIFFHTIKIQILIKLIFEKSLNTEVFTLKTSNKQKTKRFVSILLIALTLAILALSFTSGVSAEETSASTLSLYIRKKNGNKKRNLKRFRLKKRRNNRRNKLNKYIDTYGRKRRGWKKFGKKRIIRKKIDVYGKKRRFNKKRRLDTYRKKNRKNRRRGGKRNKKFDLYKRK